MNVTAPMHVCLTLILNFKTYSFHYAVFFLYPVSYIYSQPEILPKYLTSWGWAELPQAETFLLQQGNGGVLQNPLIITYKKEVDFGHKGTRCAEKEAENKWT